MNREPHPARSARFRVRERAVRLADARIEAARGGPALSHDDAAWLEAQLAHDAELAAWVERRERAVATLRREPPLPAPDGFTDRVMRVAVGPGGRESGRSRWSAGVGAAAAVAAGMVLVLFMVGPPVPGEEGVVLSGPGAALRAPAADFVVRASDLGPAAVRARLVAIATAHEGEVFARAGGADVRIPRDALVGVLQDLARQGRFRVRKVSKTPLPADQKAVVLRVELD